jgi:hypothetical protein
LVLIASPAACVLWLIGRDAGRVGLDRRLHPGNGTRRVDSRVFLTRLMLVLDSTRDVLLKRLDSANAHRMRLD